MLKEGITFEPSCPHSQEQNGVLERMGRTIMDMVRSTIIGRSIPDDLWPEIVLAMVHVKNIRPTSSLTDGRTPHELMEKKLPTIDHLQVLGSTVYVFIHEADQKGEKSKAAKFAPRAQRGKLVGYDEKTIYRVFFEKSNSIIRVKDLSIHEDATAKEATDLAYDAVQIMENTASLQQEDQSAMSNHDETTTRPLETSPELTTKRKRGRPRKEPAKVALITMLTNILSEPQWQPTNDIFYCVDSSSSNDLYVLMAKFLQEVGAYSPETFAFVTQLDVLDPPTYKAAMSSKLAEKWAAAVVFEYNQLVENHIWEEVSESDIPPGQTALEGKWVFRTKRGADGQITRHKARYVVKKYQQQYGIDYDQTFAAVVKPMAFRVLFAIAAYYDLDVEQMDVVTAFLNGIIKELIFIHLLERYEKPGIVCRLLKGLYGLKQSPRLWYEQIAGHLLEKMGLKRIHADHGIFCH